LSTMSTTSSTHRLD
jgi:hypothetical protein